MLLCGCAGTERIRRSRIKPPELLIRRMPSYELLLMLLLLIELVKFVLGGRFLVERGVMIILVVVDYETPSWSLRLVVAPGGVAL